MTLSWPLVQIGAQGENVRSIQYFLDSRGQALAIDGDFGPLTQAGVRAFQAASGLAVDGIVGDQTWPTLVVDTQTGSQGDGVKALQSQANSRGAQALALDGVFGPSTLDAVTQFQAAVGIAVDGIAGSVTWNYLVDGYLALTGSVPAGEAVYQAWTQGDRAAALKKATQGAVAELFTLTWSAAAGWTYQGANGAAGSVYLSWLDSAGRQLVLGVDDGPGGYFYVDRVQLP